MKATMRYDAEVDALYVNLADGRVSRTEEIEPRDISEPSVLVDYLEDGTVRGVEVLFAFHRSPAGGA